MMSIRNIESDDPDRASDGAYGTPARDRLLDAARQCVLSVGWRRATITDVARKAGVSRMTVYRAYADMPALLGDLMTRELSDVANLAFDDEESQPWPSRIAASVVNHAAALRGNELVRRIIDVDPELLLPYLFDRRGRTQDLILAIIGTDIAAAQASGSIRDGDPILIARSILLMTHGFTLSGRTMVDESVTEPALDAELAHAIERYLEP
jgi:AcrR family transcriptional regulator